MSVASKAFRSLKLSQEIVDLYRDEIASESLTGIITDFSDDFVYLSLFSDAGLANGIAVVVRDDVTRIRWSGNERMSIAQLASAAGTKPTRPRLSLESIQSVLRTVSETFGYVSVLTERTDESITFIGEIIELDDEWLLLETYGTFSSRDRSKLLVSCDEITRVDADASYERNVVYLAKKES